MNSVVLADDLPHGGARVSTPNAGYDPETLVIMFDGTKKAIKDIKVGDQLMGDDGTSRTVLNTFNNKCKKMYKLQRSDNPDGYIVVSGEHKIVVKVDGVVPITSITTTGIYFTYYTICTNSTSCENPNCNKCCVRKVVMPLKNQEHAKAFIKSMFQQPPDDMIYDGDIIEVSVSDYFNVLQKK
jgi:hypothetical protein